MIDASYFNGDRKRRFDDILNRTKTILSATKLETFKVDTSIVELPKVFIEGVSKTVGSDYLIPFYPKAKKIKEIVGGVVQYEVPGNFERDPDHLHIERDLVSLKYDVVCEVTNFLQGRGNLDFSIGTVKTNGFIPADYYGPGSGQMKLLVDCVLAVDSMIQNSFKDCYNILVIGSGSPGGVRSGIAYTVIPFMCNAVVDMYDINEVHRDYEIKSEKYKALYQVRKRNFDYKKLVNGQVGGVAYDLVLDDSWEKGRSRNERDENDNVSKIPNFSIKQFPWERGRLGNVYYQKFYTVGLEERRVSRDVKLVSQFDHPLGICGACRELRFRLLSHYSQEFYRVIMNLHETNCVTHSTLKYDVAIGYDSWIRVVPFVIDYDNYCSMNYDYFRGTQMIGPTFRGIRDVRVIASDRSNVLGFVLLEAEQVLVVENDGSFFVNKVISEKRYGEFKASRTEGLINLSQSQSTNQKLADSPLSVSTTSSRDSPVIKRIDEKKATMSYSSQRPSKLIRPTNVHAPRYVKKTNLKSSNDGDLGQTTVGRKGNCPKKKKT